MEFCRLYFQCRCEFTCPEPEDRRPHTQVRCFSEARSLSHVWVRASVHGVHAWGAWHGVRARVLACARARACVHVCLRACVRARACVGGTHLAGICSHAIIDVSLLDITTRLECYTAMLIPLILCC